MTVLGADGSPEVLFTRIGTPERMAVLAGYDLDSPALQAELDEVARWTSERVGAPISLVNIVLDTVQLLVGKHGVPAGHWSNITGGMPAEWSVCAYAVDRRTTYIRPDLARDPVHAGSPLVTEESFRSYAGMPIVDPDGVVLGMHCAIDVQPRQFTADQLVVLREGAERSAKILQRYRR